MEARHADRRPGLIARNRLRDSLRQWFAAADFVEIDTAHLQISPGNETHIGAFATAFQPPGGPAQPLYLHSSPEFAAKKLLAAGETRLFSLGHVYRNHERGPLHHPEFTMLEWYRAGAGLEAMMQDCAALLALTAAAAGARQLVYRDRRCDPCAEPERLSVVDAFARHAGIALEPLLGGDEAARHGFAAAAAGLGLRISADDSWSDIFSKVLAAHIEPHLGHGRATLLYDYPASEAALARLKPDDRRLAARFELYACGVELANAFDELTDAAEQRRRMELAMDERQRLYGMRYPLDEAFFAALAHMPPASGCALGFDRLVMLATGAPRIDDVIWTPLPASIG
ncbi:MAG: EF-P lysine aminoacylase GenX [Hyphomicrobiales bacterium]|nr:EF-P lysine aminoacylase GenX [Hyphomicrobiales bacterium]